jgi:hypothetical protein
MIEPRPPGIRLNLCNVRPHSAKTSSSHPRERETIDFTSLAELEQLYPPELLLHAARCVGLDLNSDLRGKNVLPQLGHLGALRGEEDYSLLQPYFGDPDHFQRFAVFMRSLDVDGGVQKPQTVDAVRYEKLLQSELPVGVIKDAEVALRRFDAAQRELKENLERVYRACEQLSSQKMEHQKHFDRPRSASISPRSASTLDYSVDRPSARVAQSVATAKDALTRTVAMLRRQAQLEEHRLLKIIEHDQRLREEHAERVASTKKETERKLIDQRHDFENRVDGVHQSNQKMQNSAKEHQLAVEATLNKISEELLSAEERRFEFLRSREINVRIGSVQRQRWHSEAARRKAEESAEAKREKDMASLEQFLARQTREKIRQSLSRERSCMEKEKEALAYQRASQLAREKIQKAQDAAEKYRAHVEQSSKEKAERLIRQRQLFEERERHRLEAIERAKSIVEKHKQDTQTLLDTLEADHEQRQRRLAYERELRDEERRLKEEKRKKLVHQYSRARKYREEAFRQHWELAKDAVQQDDQEVRKTTSALRDETSRLRMQLRDALEGRKGNSINPSAEARLRLVRSFLDTLDSSSFPPKEMTL